MKPTPIQQTTSLDWAVWFKWIIATTCGWILAVILFPAIPTIAAGFTLGIFQWLVLLYRLRQAWRWILASALGWILGGGISLLAVPNGAGILTGALVGAACGVAQWLILRREVLWSGWWIAISIMAWITGLGLLPGLFSSGALAGAISGIALILLLPNAHPVLTGEK